MGADRNGELASRFGIWNGGFTLRGTYLISPDGTLMCSEVNFLNCGRNIDEILRKFHANLHLAKHGDEGCPAQWRKDGDKTLEAGPRDGRPRAPGAQRLSRADPAQLRAARGSRGKGLSMTARILLLRRGGLGDTLLMLPLLRALRRAHPGCELHFAGVREFVDVLVAHGACDAALSSETLELWSHARARDRLAAYDLVVGDEPGLAQLAIDPRQVEPGVPFGLQVVRRAGLASRWPEDAWLGAPRAAAGPTVLAPGSGSRAKCWPRARWLETAAALGAAGDEVAVVIGPVEAERDDPRAWDWPVGVAFVAEPTPAGLAERLREAGRYLGNDSGTTSPRGLPRRADDRRIFGPTDPAVWAPPGEHVRVVAARGRELAAVTPAEVLAACGLRP